MRAMCGCIHVQQLKLSMSKTELFLAPPAVFSLNGWAQTYPPAYKLLKGQSAQTSLCPSLSVFSCQVLIPLLTVSSIWFFFSSPRLVTWHSYCHFSPWAQVPLQFPQPDRLLVHTLHVVRRFPPSHLHSALRFPWFTTYPSLWFFCPPPLLWTTVDFFVLRFSPSVH